MQSSGLEKGTNDLSFKPPETVGSEIDELVTKLLHDVNPIYNFELNGRLPKDPIFLLFGLGGKCRSIIQQLSRDMNR